MSNSSDWAKSGVRRNAQNHFTKTEKRDVTLREEREKAKAVGNAKTARLRALRLAKEAADLVQETADKEAAQKAAAEKIAAKKQRAPSS